MDIFSHSNFCHSRIYGLSPNYYNCFLMKIFGVCSFCVHETLKSNFEWTLKLCKPHNLVKPTRSSKQVALRWPPHHLTVFMGVLIHMVQYRTNWALKLDQYCLQRLKNCLKKELYMCGGHEILETMFFPWFWINTSRDSPPPLYSEYLRLQFAICYPKMTSVSYFFSYYHIICSREKLAQKKLSNFTELQFLNDKSYSLKKYIFSA